MESLSHSRPPQNKPTKKPYKATTNASTYDDVFGGPTRFGAPASTLSPSMEDYAEIFGSFHTARASSIPVLDLPAVEESEVCFDLKSPRFDYTEVFGGVEEFGLSFDDFVFRSSGRGGYDGSDDDDDDAWTPADSDSLSGELDRFVQNQCSSNGDSNQSVNGFTEFSISNHRTSARNNGEIGNEETHVAQINKIPGFTCAVDETSRLSKLEAEALSFQLDDDGHLDNTSVEMISAKHTKNHVPHPANSCVGSETIPHDVTSHRVSSKSGFHPHEPFVTVSDVSLKTKPSDLPPPSTNSSVGCEKFPQDQMSHGVSSKSGIHPRKPFVTISEISLKTKPSDLPPPSRPPPGLDVKKGISKSTSNGAILSEGIRGMSSPPFFDVEVDSNSSAAASAAAMKEVMEKAQARLKSAKEQMERRKEGVQSRTKSVSVDAMKFKEGKIDKVPNRPCSSKGEMPPSSCDAENSGLKYSVREQGQISSDKTEAAKDLLPEGFYDSVHRSGEERLGKKSQSSRVSDDIEGADEWKEETQFFELVRTDKPRKAFEQTNSKPVAPNVDDCEFGQKKKDIVMKKDEQLEGTNIENLTVKDCLREKKEKKLKELKGTCEQLEENESMKPTIVKHKKEDIEKIDKMTSLTSEQEENKGKYRTALQDVRNEKKLDTKKKAKDAGAASEWTENKEKLKTAQQHIRSEIKQTGYEPSDDLVEIQLDEKANKVELKVEHRRKEKRLLDANKIMENEKQVESHKQDYNGWGQKKTLELEVKEKEVRKSPELVETDERQVDACRRKNSKSKISEVGSEKQEKESCSPENGVKRMNGALHPDENKKRHAEAFDMEEPEKELTGTHEREEKEKRRIRSSEKYNSRIMRMVEEKKPSEAYIELEMTSEKGVESTDLEKEFSAQRTVHAGVKDKISDQVDTDDLSAPEELNFLKDKQNNQANQSSNENGEFEEQLKETREASTHEVHRKETAVVEDEKVLEPVISIVTDDEPNMSSLAERRSQNGSQQRMNEATDLQTENEVINENEEKAGVSGAGSGETWVDKNKNVSEFESRSQNHGKKPENDGMERQEDNAPVQVEFCEVEKKNKSSSGQVFKGPFGNGKKIEVGPPASSLGGGNNQNASQQACSRPSHGRREKGLNEAVKSGDIESDKMRRERKLEEERLRKIEEEREREREREKDRMALDKETLEIREKASGERVAAEARQRVMTEARERLERACAEAREKTLTEKALDARLRAERAAVERATAEARARAAEKAMAERATLGTRDRMERSVSDKSFTHSRTGGMGQSCSNSDSQDHQFRSASFSNNTRYQHSPASCERSEGVEGESAQRCKARLERHRRTAERAAKALAEKNMRDRIVQREQAERSRLAETLDADVKRWSSGKQGNLRALLSTLQYILGPESGWQPIPLTEVITSAAVKKAYRKATLYVHPDKLQQRGASVQQKYICEKVFDLLKEAWTKFNSEER